VPAQFKAAENNGVPFAIFLGEDEVANKQVKIKEMGLSKDHPEKEGILVSQQDFVAEMKARLKRKKELDQVLVQAEGLKVVDGIKKDEADATADASVAQAPAS
jgi:histidyl-tRNA synthetase